jgi:MEMO1 family protein
MIRKPLVSGMFYESSEESLTEQIKGCFTHSKGPGKLSKSKGDHTIKAVIVPHAGYQFSGPCASWAYKEIAENGLPDIFIILGTNHQAPKSCISLKDFETPLGTIKNDIHFAEKLNLEVNESAHQKEHSIEVQLPFIQFIAKEQKKNVEVVPIIVGKDYKDVAMNLKQLLQNTKKKVIIIVSSDFTHYGFNYGYAPFHENIKENLYNLDKEAINQILKLNPEKFNGYIEETSATICGRFAISCILELFKIQEIKPEAKLLQYYTSGDIVNDYGSAVGYASIIFE